jgi:hypothetical protein
MDNMMDMHMVDMVEKENLKNRISSLEGKLQIIEDNMDEILILQSPESMREIALFIKQVVKQ